MRKEIDSYIKTHQQNIVEDILDFVRIQSITGDFSANRKALDFYCDKAQQMGFKTIMGRKGDFAVVEYGGGEETLGILVHTDVVGIGDTDKWTFPPFEGKLAKGYMWGRGVVDDKGPAIMCLYALSALKDLSIPLTKKIQIIIGTCEESEWTDIASFREEFPLPDYGFSPDGDFPIFNREKGYCDVKIRFKEPQIELLEKLSSGDSPNTVPSKAVIKFKNRDEITVHGISCHSSVPEIGINAISKLVTEQGCREEFHFIRFILDFLANDYNAEKLKIDSPEVYRNPPKERTTAVPTMLHLKNGFVELNVNCRLWFGVSREMVEHAFSQYAEEYHYQFEICDFLNAMSVDENEEFLRVMARVYEDYGFSGEFRMAVGCSYAKSMPHFVSWGPVFDTEPSCAHMEDERLSVESAVIAAQMYTSYLAEMAGDNSSTMQPGEMSSLEKALFLLKFFLRRPYEYDVHTLVGHTGMNRTTVYRNLTSLEKFGFLVKDETSKKYVLGPSAEKIAEVIKLRNNN